MILFPLTGTYAVIELDVHNSLQALDDPIADAAGALIRATKCIVYLQAVLQLPVPDSPTFKYFVYGVGPGLRPPNPELCLTPDMSIPIHPNTSHPSGTRDAVVTEPPFPFSGCYRWCGRDMQFDIRILNDGHDYETDPRIALPPIQQVRLGSMRGEDMGKSLCALRKKSRESRYSNATRVHEETQTTVVDSPARSFEDVPSHLVHLRAVDVPDGLDFSFEESEGSCWDTSSSCSLDSHDNETNETNETSESLDDLGPNIFGFRSLVDDDLLPIVKIWLDLEAHIDGGSVPDPTEFIGQRDELIRIITESKTRAAVADVSPDYLQS
ncbi:hypothetical protein C8Q73DRAFT_707006 [Cubamyces lactineus]|nr:hypothetical protein C8Q73DRAFT_707006 [Cubamyces lactineus]